ncbi:hypothetical protein EBX31_06165 [bacterium]|nr:hypothetical protein [bacterium]
MALIDYAWGNREILGNESFFLLPWREKSESHPIVQMMARTAPVRFYRTAPERETILHKERADLFYVIKNGWNDGVFSHAVPTGIHAIFRESEFHGDIYAYVSPWLSRTMSHGRTPHVPHMVRLPEFDQDLRHQLGIPEDAVVFGRHGGEDSFDIPWVQSAVLETARKTPSVHFLFLNTRTFLGVDTLPNVHFLPATSDPCDKRAFLNTADFMLHGRKRGETFGLACLEFAACGKKILSFGGSPEQAHLDLLGNQVQVYADYRDLVRLLRQKKPACLQESGLQTPDDPLMNFRPPAVMEKFRQVFLS